MEKPLNIFLTNTLTENSYKAKGIKVTPNYPERQNPMRHGERLLSEYVRAKATSSITYNPDQVAAIKAKEGCYFDIGGLKGKELLTKSLEAVASGIRICNIKVSGEKENSEVVATLYIPNTKEHVFLNKISKYAQGIQEGKDKPAHDELVRSIEKIEASVVQSLWTDKADFFPKSAPIWCEVWLRTYRNDADTIKADFLSLCTQLGIVTKPECLLFPDRMIFAVLASEKDLNALLRHSDALAEFRCVAEPSGFFTDLPPQEQREWGDELVSRTVFEQGNVSVCILDTGVNNAHPLLANFYGVNSIHKVREYMASGADVDGHGTQMAGIAGYGNLRESLVSNNPVTVRHSLESVKLIGSRENEPELYGDYTIQAVSVAEIANPDKTRIVCLPITAESTADKKDGRPSSWSAAIDTIAAGESDDDKRLVLIAAGNVQLHEYNENHLKYPDAGVLHQIEDPAQSWNALSIGACTYLTQIDSVYHKGYMSVTEAGSLSPYSATSRLWNSKWPIKPEFLCEGGNAAISKEGLCDSCDDLSVLTTHHLHTQKLFTTTNATSAAVANAAWMAAQLMTLYPTRWPETIRALLVSSARWTDGMFKLFCEDSQRKKNVQKLLRACGYGIANLERAQYCAENAVNMIIEAALQPFEKRGTYCGFSQMHFHELPWPEEYLLAMGATDVELKVVLSYFIEPGPGEIGFKDKYRYPSCGLRFDVNNVGETQEQFERRINNQMQDEDSHESGDVVTNDAERWLVGAKARTVGSIHCDIWKGTAADLSQSNLIAVYPVSGWWRTRGYLNRQESRVRYSLVVTLSTPQIDVQLYTQIVNKIAIQIPVKR